VPTISAEPSNGSALAGADLFLLWSQANSPHTVNNTLTQLSLFVQGGTAEVTQNPSAGALAWNIATSPFIVSTLAANTTITFSGGVAGSRYSRATIVQGSPGGFTLSYANANVVQLNQNVGLLNTNSGGQSALWVYYSNGTYFVEIKS
jgi:hypothetical protein